ncbi:MAG: chromosome partitioning protein ParB [Mesorhizobium sp.]|nr:chromosome partitioning protein ParB [Mesorhizobium sp. M8A.F.Ca.ET.023.02.2.1]RWC75343.1 MAG: chromosome partitioning protein ParB [Mesorhizobium sp.]
MSSVPAQRVEMIPINRINVINPRIRNKKVFKEIIGNIAEIGLKRPITVTRRAEAGGPSYDLVCGQGRLEAFKALGQKEVPALVVSANQEDCLVASLVENCARRQLRAIDLLQDIGGLKQRGYSVPEIARKTGLTAEYVYAVIRLLEKGEQRLLRAVESGQIPFSVAVEIADADGDGVQAALQNAYEANLLRGRKLLVAKRLVEARRHLGKGLKVHQNSKRSAPVSSEALVRAYEQDADRKRVLIRRAEAAKGRLVFIAEALRRLVTDEAFIHMLGEEGLSDLPAPIASRIRKEASSS